MLFYLSFWSFLFIIWFYWKSLTNTLSGFFSLIIFFIILYYFFFFFVVRLTLNHHYTEPRRYQHFFNPLHSLSRKSFEEIQGYRSRLGMENQIWNLPGFWNRGARWFKSRGPPSLCCFFLCCFFRVTPHSYTKNIDDAFLSSLAGTNLQICSCCWWFPSHPYS